MPPHHNKEATMLLMIYRKLNLMIGLIDDIQRRQIAMAHDLDEVLADVASESTKLDSLMAFIAGLEQQVKDALAGAGLSPAVQAKVDAVFDAVEANKAKVQAALDAGVPPAPPIPPVTP
jgi:hypothetical protein